MAGSKAQYDNTFALTFDIDDEYKNYRELYDWLYGIVFPDEFYDYKTLVESNRLVGSVQNDIGNIYSDARLIIYSNFFTKNLEIIFENIFPLSLSSIDFSVESANIPRCTVNFAYRSFRFENQYIHDTAPI